VGGDARQHADAPMAQVQQVLHRTHDRFAVAKAHAGAARRRREGTGVHPGQAALRQQCQQVGPLAQAGQRERVDTARQQRLHLRHFLRRVVVAEGQQHHLPASAMRRWKACSPLAKMALSIVGTTTPTVPLRRSDIARAPACAT
jgi:hypothetical protein